MPPDDAPSERAHPERTPTERTPAVDHTPAAYAPDGGEPRSDGGETRPDGGELTPEALRTPLALFEGSPWVDVRAFGASPETGSDDTEAIRKAATAGSLLYFPPGEYWVSGTIELTDAKALVGSRMNSSYLRWHPDADGDGEADDLVRFTDAERRKSGLGVRDLRLSHAPRDGIHLEGRCHEWSVERCRIQDCGRHGVYWEQGWKGAVFNTFAARNGGDGFKSGPGGHAVLLAGCGALNNRVGIAPTSQSAIVGCVLESNDVDVVIDSHGVVVAGCYHEGGDYGTPDPSNPETCVRVKNCPGTTIIGGGAFVRKELGIDVVNSRATIVAPGDDVQYEPDNHVKWDHASGDDFGNLALRVDRDSHVELFGGASVPIQVEHLGSLATARASTPITEPDLLDGAGVFTDPTDGLAAGWQTRGEVDVEATDDSVYGRHAVRQHVVPREDFAGVATEASLAAGATYTVGVWLENAGPDSRVFLWGAGSGGKSGRQTELDWHANGFGHRFVFGQFSPGADLDRVGFVERNGSAEGTEFWLDGAKVVRGAFDASDFPFATA